MKVIYENELLKKQYCEYMNHYKGWAESTQRNALSAIRKFEEMTGYQDFKRFTKDWPMQIKDKIRDQNGGSFYASNIKWLERCRQFFNYVRTQSGYTHISEIDIMYFNLRREERAILKSSLITDYPDLEYFIKLVTAVPMDTRSNRRDNAFIIAEIATGGRLGSLQTLTIESLNPDKGIIYMDPSLGVKTKFSKAFITPVFEIVPGSLEILKTWQKELRELGFKDNDPLFPKDKMKKDLGCTSYSNSDEVIPDFYKSKTHLSLKFVKYAGKAGLIPYNAHRFRHGMIRQLFKTVRSGEELKALSQILGHKTVYQILKSYANLDKEEIIAFGKMKNEQLNQKNC